MLKLNKHPVEVTRFPDGTSQVWKLPFKVGPIANIDWTFTQEGELFHLAQLVDLVRHEGAEYISLNMDFLPYGRQDKVVSNETTFALNTFARMINDMKFDKVTSLDTHNPQFAIWNINNFHHQFPFQEIGAASRTLNPEILCFPDKGATSRYAKELAFLGKIHVHGDKERDQLTGHIVKYALHGDVFNKKVLIIDDICDGGMTFIHLAKALLTAGASSVNLYTTHGIYSKGLKPLREAKIERIFNKDGEVSEVQDQVVVREYV